MLPAKDTNQVLNINESTTDSPIQETSDNNSRFHGLKRFRTEYLSRDSYVSIHLLSLRAIRPSSLHSKQFSIGTKDH